MAVFLFLVFLYFPFLFFFNCPHLSYAFSHEPSMLLLHAWRYIFGKEINEQREWMLQLIVLPCFVVKEGKWEGRVSRKMIEREKARGISADALLILVCEDGARSLASSIYLPTKSIHNSLFHHSTSTSSISRTPISCSSLIPPIFYPNAGEPGLSSSNPQSHRRSLFWRKTRMFDS